MPRNSGVSKNQRNGHADPEIIPGEDLAQSFKTGNLFRIKLASHACAKMINSHCSDVKGLAAVIRISLKSWVYVNKMLSRYFIWRHP